MTLEFIDHRRPPVPSYIRGNEALLLEPALGRRLGEFCAREGVQPFVVVLAAFEAVLVRYTGQEQIVIGSGFPQVAVLHTDLAGDPSGRELIQRVGAAVRHARENGGKPAAGPSIPFRIMCLAAGDSPAIEEYTADCDLVLTAAEQDDTFVLACDYDRELLDAATIGRLLGHLREVLDDLTADPGRRLSCFTLLSPGEWHQVLVEWNRTRNTEPVTRCLHELLREQAARTPDAPAVVCEGQTLSYAELSGRAARLALILRRRGLGPDVLVGVCLERSLDLVVGILGVLHAGGAYLPLDPAYPGERLRYLLGDSGIGVLLTQRHLRERAPVREGATVLCLDEAAAELAREPTTPPAVSVDPRNLAYVIYTSGSTGRPKGVAIQQDSTVEYLRWCEEQFGSDEIQAVLASTSVCFDLSVFEIFFPLTHGGCVVMVRDALKLSAAVDGIASGLTMLNAVPSTAAEWLRQGIPASVRTLLLGGEPLPSDLVDQLHNRTSVDRIYNLYGPTEDTVCSTSALVERGTTRISIGRPIRNTQCYVLDGRLAPVPVGVAGELYLGGAGLARGYLGRPALTAERFLPDPFGGVPGARLYRTGDRVRWHAEGTLEFLGRVDQQIKLRGYRIEPGEIEATLRQHPGVREAAVVLREDQAGELRLVAYVVPRDGQDPGPGELRAHLEARLPAYMVPGAFVSLPALPRSPNGKLDRRALPALSAERPVEAGRYRAPRTPTEEVLARIWADVLQLERVGAEDNFFELGGHSLLATQVVSRTRRAFGLDIDLYQFFEAPTLSALASLLEKPGRPGTSPP